MLNDVIRNVTLLAALQVLLFILLSIRGMLNDVIRNVTLLASLEVLLYTSKASKL